MTDNFAEGLIARLQQCSLEQSEPITHEDYTASLTPLNTCLQKLLTNIPFSAQHQGLSLLGIQARLRGQKKAVRRTSER